MTLRQTQPMLCAQALKEIDRTIAKYPPEHKRSAVMAALAVAQDEHGWLSTAVMRYVADYLDMPAIAVQEVATFYSLYRTAPDGKFTLKEGECMGACGDAPVLLVNHKRMCGFMTSDRIDRLLKELSA